jgi:hypothetical protein
MDIPDTLGLLRTYLAAQLTPKPVVTRVPVPRPDAWVQLRRVGGTKAPPVRDRPRIDVFAWAANEPAAMALLLQVRALVTALHGTTAIGVEVYRVQETLGPRQIDDDPSGQPGAWMTFSILNRAEDLVR